MPAADLDDRYRRTIGPLTSVERTRRWQDRFNSLLLIAALLAVTGVALQVAHFSRATDIIGFVTASAGWVIFAANAIVMVRVSDRRWKWIWSHTFELIVVVVAFPAWPLVVAHLTVLELVPAVTVLEAAKLAKLAEALRVVRRREQVGVIPVGAAAVVVILAVAAAGIMLGS